MRSATFTTASIRCRAHEFWGLHDGAPGSVLPLSSASSGWVRCWGPTLVVTCAGIRGFARHHVARHRPARHGSAARGSTWCVQAGILPSHELTPPGGIAVWAANVENGSIRKEAILAEGPFRAPCKDALLTTPTNPSRCKNTVRADPPNPGPCKETVLTTRVPKSGIPAPQCRWQEREFV